MPKGKDSLESVLDIGAKITDESFGNGLSVNTARRSRVRAVEYACSMIPTAGEGAFALEAAQCSATQAKRG